MMTGSRMSEVEVERNVEWDVTLCTAADRNCLLQLPAIAVKGHQVQVGGVRKSARRLRVFCLPYYVPINSKYQKGAITCQHIDYTAMCC